MSLWRQWWRGNGRRRAANLDNLDAPVSDTLAFSEYTAPDNAGVAAIKAQTDQLVFDGGSVAATFTSEVITSLADDISTQVWANMPEGAIEVTLTQPVLETGELALIQGDDYKQTDGRALRFTSSHWPDLTDSAVVLRIDNVLDATATVLAADDVRVELDGADTALLSRGHHAHAYALVAALSSGSTVTLATGMVNVSARID